MWSVVIPVWLVLAVLVTFVAVFVGRGAGTWFAASVLLSPGVALAALLILCEVQRLAATAVAPAVGAVVAVDEVVPRLERLFDQGKLSPEQLERISALARREPPAAVPTPAPRSSADEFTRPCPSCGRLISPKATACMHCFAKVTAPVA